MIADRAPSPPPPLGGFFVSKDRTNDGRPLHCAQSRWRLASSRYPSLDLFPRRGGREPRPRIVHFRPVRRRPGRQCRHRFGGPMPEQAMDNVEALLAVADMTAANLVKL